MKKLLTLFAAICACSFSTLASAVPVNAKFDGAVSGSGFFTDVLNDFPAGTTAAFDVTFDDAGLVPSLPVTDYDVSPVSGWARLGSHQWSVDDGRIYSFSYLLSPGNPVLWYGLQLTGSGPTIGGNGSLFGLFLFLTPQLSALPGAPPVIGFGYPFSFGTFYSYANLTGNFATSRQVPEPSPGLLICGALLLLTALRGWQVRSRVVSRKA